MGIDAKMFVKIRDRQLTDQDIQGWLPRLCGAFGTDSFWIDPNRRHALQLVDQVGQDSNEEPEILPRPNEQFVQVSLMGRYYGVGYERGDYPFYRNLGEWLEINLQGEVWYGGDSSGVLFRRFDAEYRDVLWRHFCRVGHDPYLAPIDRMMFEGNQAIPPCPNRLCSSDGIWVNGGGRTFIGAMCQCCGRWLRTHDNGDNWYSGPNVDSLYRSNGPEHLLADYHFTRDTGWTPRKPLTFFNLNKDPVYVSLTADRLGKITQDQHGRIQVEEVSTASL